jgi:hypothetical protein
LPLLSHLKTSPRAMCTTTSTRRSRQRAAAVKLLSVAIAVSCASAFCGDLRVANAQDTGTQGVAQQEEAFQRKQKRRLAVGWALIGAGTALSVSTVWISRTGGDASVGLKRSLAVVIPGVAMVLAGGGVLIKRRIKRNEHNSATQVRLAPTSILVERRF